jgi:hypothetical protein
MSAAPGWSRSRAACCVAVGSYGHECAEITPGERSTTRDASGAGQLRSVTVRSTRDRRDCDGGVAAKRLCRFLRRGCRATPHAGTAADDASWQLMARGKSYPYPTISPRQRTVSSSRSPQPVPEGLRFTVLDAIAEGDKVAGLNHMATPATAGRERLPSARGTRGWPHPEVRNIWIQACHRSAHADRLRVRCRGRVEV